MTITRSRSQVMIVLAWLSGIALALPYVLLCTISHHHSSLQRSLHIIFTIMQTAIGYFFPFVGLCWLYLRMYHAAHRNSERTRKHSISGELLTVMDGSTSVIPQGIDFLTHYMNPFTRAPMAGSVQPMANGHQENRNSIGQVMPIVVKKSRRRSSNGSSSSLLFREEGRAIKTAFFVLASFFVCWTPHFALMLINEMSSDNNQQQHFENVTSEAPLAAEEHDAQQAHHHHNASYTTSTTSGYGSDWARFLGVFGMLLSSVLNPFIYVFRNKIACEEICRLLYGLFGVKLLSKEDQQYHQQSLHNKERKASENGSNGGGAAHPMIPASAANPYDNDGLPSDAVDYQPRYSPCIGKSPKRSSMKSLTPQSSINSSLTNCNSVNGCPTTDSPSVASARTHNDSSSHHHHHHITFSNGRAAKPPFMRSLTLPEQQTQPRVKFPPNLTRQKSYASYRQQTSTHSSGQSSTEITPAISKRAKFVRQDSVCSILSNDSVLMICSEDGMEVGPLGVLNLGLSAQTVGIGNGVCNRGQLASSTITRVPEGDSEEEGCPSKACGSSIQGTPVAKCYLRQDSNFSDASHRTNDSGVVLSSTCSYSTRHSDSLNTSSSITATPERCCRNLRQVSPTNSPQQQPHQNQQQCKSREVSCIVHHNSQHQNDGKKLTCSSANTVAMVNKDSLETASRHILPSSASSTRNSPILLQTSI